MFRTLVQDESVPSSAREAAIDEQVAMCVLDMDDPDIILDMRKRNGKPGSSEFDMFWLELSTYLEKVGPAVQERRRGETTDVNPICHICESLGGSYSSRCKEKFPQDHVSIPSLEWIRLQFRPRNYDTLADSM